MVTVRFERLSRFQVGIGSSRCCVVAVDPGSEGIVFNSSNALIMTGTNCSWDSPSMLGVCQRLVRSLKQQ